MPIRWLPKSARLVRLTEAEQLVAELRMACTAQCWGIPPEQYHRTGRFRTDLQRVLMVELDARVAQVDAIIRGVASELLPVGTELAVQARPYARVVPPQTPDAVKDFHWDAYLGHPNHQWGLWVPLVDIEGEEGLWLVEDEVVAPFVERGVLTAEATSALRQSARVVPMRSGEVLVMESTTGHGGVAHALDRTRVSFDVRFARAGEEPRRAMGWRSRRVTL